MINTEECLLFLKEIILQAGLRVLEIYQKKDFEIKIKNDNSPLTRADLISHEIICRELSKNYPTIPILSEETCDSFSILNSNSLFWCIDPIDGTKEFIKRNDEFTINIALISNKKPILGLIYAPALGQLYYASKGQGSFYETKNLSKKIMAKKADKHNLVVAVSRSHLSEKTHNFLDSLKSKTTKSIGSSLKLCGVAMGEVDCYPRFGPTSLWDIAAGHIIVNEAGGYVLDKNFNEIEYDFTKGFLNSDFFAINHFFYEELLNDKKNTYQVEVGNIFIGGGAPIVIQSMTNTDTADRSSTVSQIIDLWKAGSEIVRITVNNEDSAKQVADIKKSLLDQGCDVPLVGDFHFNGHKLLTKYPKCAELLDKYRINPGNVGKGSKRDDQFSTMIKIAMDHNKPVRIGVNWGSLDQDLLKKLMDMNAGKKNPDSAEIVMQNALIASVIDSAKLAEDIGLNKNKIIVSCKVSEVQDLINIYTKLSKLCNYPLHLGLTEAGMGTKGIVSSAVSIGHLLQSGIGDTIRVSLTPEPNGDRTEEVKVSQQILQSLSLRSFKPSVIACPGCGRTTSTYFQELANEIQFFLNDSMHSWKSQFEGIEEMKVAVMGCVVNGPGESKMANLGISLPGTGEIPVAPVYEDGKKTVTLKGDTIAIEFKQIIESYIIKNYKKKMAKQFQSIKGFYDIPPDRQKLFRHFEDIALNVFDSYAYEEIGLPIVEPTGLFIDSVGSFTDIVEKEMYSWVDHLNNDKLTLRPEGTAGCVRAVIQNSLTYNGPVKLFYRGAMFRHENVQKGRQRQFTQLGAESFGIENPIADAEQIIMLSRLWDNLGLKNIKLVINSIGDKDCRQKHRHELIEYFKKNSALLDEDSKRRLNDNPLRILDSKNPEMQDMLNGAPKIMEYLNESALNHFDELKRLLDENQVKYEVNSRLVRGLDYYNRTVFEWISNDLGSQGTIAGGGRYDYLIENLGGKSTFACGFAIGIERIILLLEKSENPQSFYNSDIYIVCQGHGTQNYAINIAEKLRSDDYKVSMNLENSSFKSQFKKADKSNAKIALIIGEDELKNNIIQIKLMRNEGSQESVGVNDLLQRVRDIFKN